MEGVTRLRVIHDPPAAGDWNMAVDEMMFETVAASGEPILRFYQWQEPTLSLGYFQSLQERQSHSASMACPVVRRSTGGGAIVHDRELTYSIATPLAARWSSAASGLYDTMHNALIGALASSGLVATLCAETLSDRQQEFLCFQRRAAGDVLVAGRKVAGSAQRRRQGALLQHGSVILAQSQSAPEIMGLKELGLNLSSDELSTRWLRELQASWPDAKPRDSVWSPQERDQANELVTGRFSASAWLAKRS
jgi:lipoate-protein ligase A